VANELGISFLQRMCGAPVIGSGIGAIAVLLVCAIGTLTQCSRVQKDYTTQTKELGQTKEQLAEAKAAVSKVTSDKDAVISKLVVEKESLVNELILYFQ
jgi:hypothetical protein